MRRDTVRIAAAVTGIVIATSTLAILSLRERDQEASSCVTVPGEKGADGAGNGGAATVCGAGTAIGGKAGTAHAGPPDAAYVCSTTNIASISLTSSTLVTMDLDGSNVRINWPEVERQAAGADPYLMPLAKALLAARRSGSAAQ